MIFKLALKNLKRNKRRSLSILLTVGLGIGALHLYHGFNFGIMNQYKINTIKSRYGHGSINTAGYQEKVFEKPWEHWIKDYAQLKDFLKVHPQVQHLFPRVEFYAMLTNGHKNVSAKGQGIDAEEEFKFFNALNIEEGKNLSHEADGILLGKGLARSLDLKVGDMVTVLTNTIDGSLNGIDLFVTGIFHTGTKVFDDTVFRLPLTQAHVLLNTDLIESVSLGLKSDDDWKQVASDLINKFPHLEATPFEILDKVYYQNAIDFLKSQFDTIRLVILLIVILGIFNTISSGVLERKQEIGSMRANGESNQSIMGLLCLESFFLGLIGAAAGLLFAYFMVAIPLHNGILMPPSPGLTRHFHVLIELQSSYALSTLILGPITALIGTILAGYSLTKKPIADLLRSN
jgi:putative ABC transport system permease protein